MATQGFELKILFSGLNMFVPLDKDTNGDLEQATSDNPTDACTVLLMDAGTPQNPKSVRCQPVAEHFPLLLTDSSPFPMVLRNQRLELEFLNNNTPAPAPQGDKVAYEHRADTDEQGTKYSGPCPGSADDARAWHWVTKLSEVLRVSQDIDRVHFAPSGHQQGTSPVIAQVHLTAGKLRTESLVVKTAGGAPLKVCYDTQAGNKKQEMQPRAAAEVMSLTYTVTGADAVRINRRSLDNGDVDGQPLDLQPSAAGQLRIAIFNGPLGASGRHLKVHHFGLLAALWPTNTVPAARWPIAEALENDACASHVEPLIPDNYPICPGGEP